MKSWIAFFLPEDEYKEKKVLYFIAEGAALLLIVLTVMLVLSLYFDISGQLGLLLGIAVFLFYVTGRYLLSGIEYANVATEQDYKKELKSTLFKMASFGLSYFVIYIVIIGVPENGLQWVEIIGFVLFVSFIWFLASFISLKRSYKKNQVLM